MFMKEKDVVLMALVRLGDACCCYTGGEWLTRRCDCKYGGPKFERIGSEQTGCPEIREAYKLIDAMTDHEFTRLVKRSGGVITGRTWKG